MTFLFAVCTWNFQHMHIFGRGIRIWNPFLIKIRLKFLEISIYRCKIKFKEKKKRKKRPWQNEFDNVMEVLSLYMLFFYVVIALEKLSNKRSYKFSWIWTQQKLQALESWAFALFPPLSIFNRPMLLPFETVYWTFL